MTDTRLASTISNGGAKVHTVEHLMSACAGLGMDNLYVDITAEEVPILDGSSASFVFLLQSAGIELQNAPRRFIRVLQPVEVREGEGDNLKWARLEPYHGYKLSFEIDFAHRVVDSTGQRVEFDLGTGSYARDIARARTFGFTKDVEMMRANGLALGGGLDNAVVMDDYRVLNTDGLRYDDEFVKHKMLDAMGDLYLIGKPLLASYSAFRSGPRAEQQAAARTAGAAGRLRGRHLRGREATRPPASRSRRAPGRRPMLLFRWAILLLLLAAGVCFAFYAGTGEVRFRRFGLIDAEVDADRGVRFLRGADRWSGSA